MKRLHAPTDDPFSTPENRSAVPDDPQRKSTERIFALNGVVDPSPPRSYADSPARRRDHWEPLAPANSFESPP